MKALGLCMVALFITGCAPDWKHPSKSQQQYHADNAECSAMSGKGMSNQIQENTGTNATWNQSDAFRAYGDRAGIYSDCMQGKGWSR